MPVVYRAGDIAEAHIVCGMLQAEGLHAWVEGHFLQGGIGELATMDFARVQVNDEDVEAALKLIADYENAPGEE